MLDLIGNPKTGFLTTWLIYFRCGYNLMRLWTTEIAHSPFTAAPLIADVDADGQLDIVAAPLSEAQTVVSAETGKSIPNTKWPTQKLDSSVFSSPLQVP